jgi:hypothetical protein
MPANQNVSCRKDALFYKRRILQRREAKAQAGLMGSGN